MQNQHSEPNEVPLHEYIDMDVYDVVPGEKYRALEEQLGAAHQFILHVADGTFGSWEAAASEARSFLGEPDESTPAISPEVNDVE